MRYIRDGITTIPLAKWSELTGSFPTLEAAEGYVENPPPDARQAGTVTIARTLDGGWKVFHMEGRLP